MLELSLMALLLAITQDHHHHAALIQPAAHHDATTSVTITIDPATRHQRFDGFGGSLSFFENDGFFFAHDPTQPKVVSSTEAQRREIASMLYERIGATRARLVLRGFEPGNDNADPGVANPSRFDWTTVDFLARDVAQAKPLGLRTPWLSFDFDGVAHDAWRRRTGSTCALDPALLDEEVEWLLEAVQHFKGLGLEPEFMTINNEPDLCESGYKIEIADYVTIVKRLGRRMRERGIGTKIVVSDGWIPRNAILYMQAVLSDSEARSYVGALAYHSYDFYDNASGVLDTSGAGSPPHEPAAWRDAIRMLAAQYDLPVWMTEVCYCTPRHLSDWEGIRARLNHVHDELTITNVAAFDVMNLWFIRRPHVNDELVEVYFRPDGPLERSEIARYGTAIAHYAKYIPAGATRIGASSTDARVRVSAFQTTGGDVTIVALNNNDSAANVSITLGAVATARLTPVITSEESVWAIGTPIAPDNGTIAVTIPGRAIVTLTTMPLCGASGEPSKPCRKRRAVRHSR